MLKLDEKGWGLGFLIFFIVLFMIILIGVSLGIKSLGKKIKKNDSVPLEETKQYDRMYSLMEQKLENAAEYYTLDNETFFDLNSSNVKITYEYLLNRNYIDELTDPIYNTPCTGFVIVENEDNISAYISCDGYKTADYDSWS